MRARIFRAATACIADVGFHRTSLAAVIDRAQVSQGALQHHFPTKLDLMAGVAGYLLDRSIRWFARIADKIEDDPCVFSAIISRSWREVFQSDENAALVEILVASRTDADLRQRICPALTSWRDAVDRELAAIYPGEESRRALKHKITISRAMMTGFVVQDVLLGADPTETIDYWSTLAMSRKSDPVKYDQG
ncbi:MAG: TetR/AcrR family transcriptional regulator [Pseudomonadota bacterium]